MKYIALVILLATACLNLTAQKLPNIQQAGLRAPANIKIDGKADEWNGKFQAYNNAAEVFYTMCNDDQNVYLIIRSDKADVNTKILLGGITLTIDPGNNLKNKNVISITYPLFNLNQLGTVTNALSREQRKAKDSTATIANVNAPLTTGAKQLEVKGLTTNNIEKIAIYNEEGVQVKALFENAERTIAYVYELAIPLKYLRNTKTFAYNLKLNEPRRLEINEPLTAPPPPPVIMNAVATTDFSGSYTLAK